MSAKSQVKEIIDAYIHRNGNQEITGNILNGVLSALLDAGVIDIIQDGAILPKDEDGNVVIPDFSLDGAVRYDIEQILTEVQKELARRNINAPSVQFVVDEAQSVYNAAGILVTSERDRAEAAEELIKSIADSKLTRIDLACDGYEPLKITYRGQTEALTFAELYGLVTDKSKFVTLLDSEMFILLPSLSVDGDAIEFAGINVMSHQAEAQRVIINQENQVSVYPIELEDSGRKVSSAEGISGADAFIKYPNIKALQDYVAAHGGGLTPEQEQKLNDAITDAPSDGKQYARKDGAWAEVQGGESDELIAEWHYPVEDYPPIVFSSYDSTTGYFYCDNIPSWATDGMSVCIDITDHVKAANTVFPAGNQKAVIAINIIDEHHISLTGAIIPSSVDVSAFRLVYIVNHPITIPSSLIKQEGDEFLRIELIDVAKNISKYGDGVVINCSPSIINGSSPSGILPEIGYDVASPISSITTAIIKMINGGKDGYEQISTKQYCLKRTNQTTFTTSFIFANSYGVYALWGYSSTINDIYIHIDSVLCLPTSSIRVYKIKNAYETL